MKRVLTAVSLLVVINACGRGIDSKKFDAVLRAGQVVQSATGFGELSLPRYRELLEAFAVEIAIARDNASNGAERDVVMKYGEALSIYKDALPIWSLKYVGSTQLYYQLTGQDNGLVFPGDEHSEIIARYEIPYVEGRPTKTISVNVALKRIWTAAGKKLHEVNKASRG